MLGVEGVKRAQTRFGKKPLTGEQVRWGLENLALDAAAIKKIGFTGFMDPIQTTCVDHEGSHSAHIETWDGKQWHITAGPYASDLQIIRPLIHASAAKYAAETKSLRAIVPRKLRNKQESVSACAAIVAAQAVFPAARAELQEKPQTFGERPDECHAAHRERHRSHLQPRHSGVERRVAHRRRRQDRRAPRRQWRRQDHHAARGVEPAQGRARRCDQGLYRIQGRAHRKAHAGRSGQARRGSGDGGASLLPAPVDRGEPADRGLHAQRRARRDRGRPRNGLLLFPAFETAAREPRRLHLGRRAADDRGGARADGAADDDPAGRAVHGPRAAARRRNLRDRAKASTRKRA